MSTKLRVSDLDFKSIKQSFIDYLKTVDEFKDYNFDASGISTLLNVLSYNTHYTSLMANFLANEIWLDTAVKRSSIVSRAKELGYVPKSRHSAEAILTVEFKNVTNNPPILTLAAGTTFSAQVDNNNYTFTTLVPFSTAPVNENGELIYRFANINVYEGVLVENTTVYDRADYTVVIPNKDIDTNTLRVLVTSPSESQEIEYFKNETFLSLTADSKVFFLQEGFDEFYEVYFGDGILGVNPDQGSTITMNYLVTSGEIGNNANNFMITLVPYGAETSSVSVETISISAGGTEREDQESIRLGASNTYIVQNRGVINSDYMNIIRNSGINVGSVVTWGGEDNTPPKFNKIMVCVKPLVGDSLTQNQKDQITALIKSKSVSGITPEFITPDYIDIILSTVVNYDVNRINVSVDSLINSVRNNIVSFSAINLSEFGSILRISNLQTEIDKTDESILSNSTKFYLQKQLIPILNTNTTFQFSFANPVSSISSSSFLIHGTPEYVHLEDNGAGSIDIVYYKGSAKIKVVVGVGDLDYITGNVNIYNLNILSLSSNKFFVDAQPIETDVKSSQRMILRMQSSNITVSVKVN